MAASLPTDESLRGRRVLLAGKLSGMSRREAQQLVRSQGGIPVERLDQGAELVVVGDDGLSAVPSGDDPTDDVLVAARRQAAETGAPRIVDETELWQLLGFVEPRDDAHRLYTPGMLAGLLGVHVAVVRSWRRRGLIVPVREVRRLPYFDFQEVTTARRLAELLSAGVSAQAIERKLASLRRVLPGVARPLAQLSAIVEGKDLLLRRGAGLIDTAGQRRIDFEQPCEAAELEEVGEAEAQPAADEPAVLSIDRGGPQQGSSPADLLDWAAELEEAGRLAEAAEMVRAALAAGGANAETCFRLAELLYRQGDLTAARERYYMAVELNEDYVEARANLGCLLAELGEGELAVAAFQGALRYHDEYPDAHYHLARALDDLRRPDEARHHWRRFLDLSPESPWATEARERVT